MNFEEIIKQKKSITSVEVVPPRGKDLNKQLTNLEKLRDRIDIVSIVDSPLSIPRMHPVALCHKIKKNLNIDTIMHFTCRDRNKIEIEAVLLAAHALGVRNILALTGDKIKNAKPVFEFSSIGLIEFIQRMNEKYDTNFFVGAGMNINATSLEKEIERAKKKIKSGAKFVFTQPCFSVDKIRNLNLKIPVIAGVLLISERKKAEFFDNVPGIEIPKNFFEIVNDMGELVNYYKKLISDLRKVVNGISLMPIGNYEFINEFI